MLIKWGNVVVLVLDPSVYIHSLSLGRHIYNHYRLLHFSSLFFKPSWFLYSSLGNSVVRTILCILGCLTEAPISAHLIISVAPEL